MSIHIGQIIEGRLDAMGISKAEFARRINRARQNVNDIINRPSVDTDLLLIISRALDYNFFQHYMIDLAGDNKVRDNPGEYVNMEMELRACVKELDVIESDILRTRNELRTTVDLNEMYKEKISLLNAENGELKRQLGISGPKGEA